MNFSQDWLCVSTDDIILLNKAGEYRFSHVSVCGLDFQITKLHDVLFTLCYSQTWDQERKACSERLTILSSHPKCQTDNMCGGGYEKPC